MCHYSPEYLEKYPLDGQPVGYHFWPSWVRVRILYRDNYTCKGCAKRLPRNKLVVHHLKYTDKVVSKNLVTLCDPCHGKVHSGKLKLNV